MPIFCSEGRVIKRQSDLDSSCLYCWTGRIEIIVEEVAPEMVIMGESYIQVAKREYGLGQTRAKFWWCDRNDGGTRNAALYWISMGATTIYTGLQARMRVSEYRADSAAKRPER